MKRKIAGLTGIATVVAGLGLATTAVPGASAAPEPEALPSAKGEPQLKPDNRPDALSRKQTALRKAAVDALVAGDARTVGQGADRTIRMPNGVKVDYPASQQAQLLTFLVEFGDDASNPEFPDNTAGPVHNDIPEPGADDNTTYWLPDFDRQHFLDMFFNGLEDQNGESFRSVYQEMSSGRFMLNGDVSDWVQVPNAASYYSADDGEEPGNLMKEFLEDGADAWYADQVADGKTPEQIQDYLSDFDVWDRFDFDGDGNYNEPDGYIDHFQAVHAGEDESAGAEPWAIWAHRSATNTNGKVGPDFNKNGGVQIGTSGFWIRDYTVEPENGGLGVFAHEFAHDLGIPDYYDTQNGDNGTGFWTLMSRGSWMGHGADTIGTTPNHMGAPDKLFLGWYGADDLAVVDGEGAPQTVDLGPSYHATDQGAQAVAVTLPQGQATIDVVEPDGEGTRYLYSGNGNDRVATATSPSVSVPDTADPTLTARVSFSIEDDWDYAYLKVSEDNGVSWDYVETNLSTSTDPNQQNAGHGITGCSGERDDDGVCDMAWADLDADLSAYAGEDVKLQFEMYNDAAYYELGFAFDNVKIDDTLVTDVEDGAPDWVLRGFQLMEGSSYVKHYDRYYLAENRQPMGYDKTLVEGPYSFDYPVSAPGVKVDHFPYQDGLLIWYVNGLYEENDASVHPGEGYALPVDANPEYVFWKQGATPKFYANGDLQARDATFDVDDTDALHLTNEQGGGVTFDVDAHPSVPVFDDSDPEAYIDDYNTRTQWYTVRTAGVGSMIQVISSDEAAGTMVVKAGQRFVAVTGGDVSISGTPAIGQTVTGVAPEFFGDVSTSYKWKIDGQLVWGGQHYAIKDGDAGKTLSLTVTGTKDGYLPFEKTVTVQVATKPAPTATKAVAVGGNAVVGQTLTATPATWSVDGTSTYVWKANGQQVGAGPSYTLKPGDTGKQITVTETRSAAGYTDGTSTSVATAAVAPAPTSMAVDAPKKVKRGHKGKVMITVSAPGITPTGTVEAVYGGDAVKVKVLTGGQYKVKLPKRGKTGKVSLVIRFLPDTGFTSAEQTLKVKITKH